MVAVVGCQRSGTTLTGQILGAHSKAILFDEDHGLYSWFHKFSDQATDAEESFTDMLWKVKKSYRKSDDRIVTMDSGDLTVAPQISHIVLKAPNLTYHFAKLADIATAVRIVYVVRDPRAVVASMSNLSHIPMVENQRRLLSEVPYLARKFATELGQLSQPRMAIHKRRALVWRMKSALAEEFVAYGMQTLLLRYEDLIEDKAMRIRLLADHAGLSFEDNLLSHQAILRGKGPGGTCRGAPISSNSLEKWESQLSKREADEIMQIAGSIATRFGYR